MLELVSQDIHVASKPSTLMVRKLNLQLVSLLLEIKLIRKLKIIAQKMEYVPMKFLEMGKTIWL